ncbi:MAG: hypothetical protein AAFQ87_24010 [Bacteroidota bacterium]
MYRIQKIGEVWNIRNNHTGRERSLLPKEVQKLLEEFPALRHGQQFNYFRNRISSIADLPV